MIVGWLNVLLLFINISWWCVCWTPTTHTRSATRLFSITTTTTTAEQCDDQLAQHIRNQHWEGVLQVLQTMQDAGFEQTERTFLKCLQATTTTTTTTTDKNTLLLSEVWNALKQTVEPTREHVEYVLQHCAPLDDTVWSLLRQESQTHNWALQGLAKRGQWKAALREWKQQQQQQQAAFNTTTTTTITPETYRALWNVCMRANDCPIDTLLQVLQAAGPILSTNDAQDILTTITRQRSWRDAMTIWEFFQQQQTLLLSLQCYQTLLFHRHLPLAKALFLLRHLQRRQFKPTIEIYNRIMYLALQQHNTNTVFKLLQELQQHYNLQPNVVTYTHVVRACCADRQWKRAGVVFEVARDKLPQLDVYLYTAAMEACVKSKQSSRALELLQEMQQQQHGIVPNSFTYRVAMQAAPHRALEFLDALKQVDSSNSSSSSSSSSSIPLITYNAALQALAQTAKQQAKQQQHETSNHTAIWEHAVDLLDEIKQQNLQPDGFTYNAVIMCCCHGPWELALQYIQEMQDSSLPPNRLVYTAAIASCGKHGQAEHALQLLAQMKQHKIQPDLVTYNAVFTALRVAQKPEEAMDLWKELLTVTQPTALSRIGDRNKRQYTTTTLAPDIITVTEVIGTLAGTNDDEYQTHVDDIVAYAVERKLLLNGFLDSSNEINLSGLTFPVARAACRYLLQQYQHVNDVVDDLTLITGVGKQQQPNKTSLRDYLQEWLETEFGLKTSIPRLAQGTLVISSESLLQWTSR